MSRRFSVTLIHPSPRLRKRDVRSTNVQMTVGQFDGFQEWRKAWFKRLYYSGGMVGFAISTLGQGLWVIFHG